MYSQKCPENFFKISKFLYMIHVHSQKYKRIFNFFSFHIFEQANDVALGYLLGTICRNLAFFWLFFFPKKIIEFVTNFEFVFAKVKKNCTQKKKAGSTSINLNRHQSQGTLCCWPKCELISQKKQFPSKIVFCHLIKFLMKKILKFPYLPHLFYVLIYILRKVMCLLALHLRGEIMQ